MSGRYRYCGLRLESSLELPALPMETSDLPAELEIREAPVPDTLPDAACRSALYEIADKEALWRLEGVARYRISRGGTLIEVECHKRADPAAVRLLLLHPVFTLALLQRGEFMLNAAAIAVGGKTIAFAGPSAVGKSTVAALLAARGHRVVADGLLRLTIAPDGTVLGHPQAPWLLLWPDAIEALAPGGAAQPVRAGIELKRVMFPAVQSALPLASVLNLRENRGDEPEVPEPTLQSGADGFGLIAHNTVGKGWIDRTASLRLRHFPWAAAVAGAVPIGCPELPWGWGEVDRLVEILDLRPGG